MFPFQLEGARSIRAFGGRALLADEQGLGKTVQALYWLRKKPSLRPAVVVAPASVKWGWHSEAVGLFDMRLTVLDGHCKKRTVPLPDGDVYVLNYEILESWLPSLLRVRPKCVILDEVHYIKDPRAKRSIAAHKLCRKARSVVGLSGTPMTNRPIELWSVLKAIRPDLFPSRTIYAWRYCKPRHTRWGWVFDGCTRAKELRHTLRDNVMIRRLKRNVMPEMPPKVRHVVPFMLKAGALEEYGRAEQDFIGWLGSQSPGKAQRARKSQALVKVGYLMRLAGRLKLEWSLNWVAEFLFNHPDKKLIVLTSRTATIDALRNRFGKLCVVVDGRVTGRRRHEAVRRFQTSGRCRLFCGNTRAAGVGITLHAAHNVAYLDFPWTPGDLVQGEDRAHRIGQKETVFVHYLVAMGTSEERLAGLLRSKSKVLDAVLDGGATIRDLDVFDALLRSYSKLKR